MKFIGEHGFRPRHIVPVLMFRSCLGPYPTTTVTSLGSLQAAEVVTAKRQTKQFMLN